MDPTDDNPASPLSKQKGSVERSHEESIAAGEVPGAPLTPAALPTGLGVEAIQGPYGIRQGDHIRPALGTGFAPGEGDPEEFDSAEPGAPASLPADSLAGIPDSDRPSFRFFGIVAALSLIADITTKVWAEVVINERGFEPIKIVGENISITLAYNQGGAWGLFAGAEEVVRKPFFLGVSAFAIFFIISLYSKLHPSQKALKWGLPLVLGGALGNLSDRITRSQVIDFIDYRGDWVLRLNSFVHKYFQGWAVTDHWPTFNVADVAICVGVGLMAVDMFTHRPRPVASQNGDGSLGPSSPSSDADALDRADDNGSSDPMALDADAASQDQVVTGSATS